MRFEERRIRRILMRNTGLFFVVLAVLFSLFGALIFQLVSANIYQSADEQLDDARGLVYGAMVDFVPSAQNVLDSADANAVAADEALAQDVELLEADPANPVPKNDVTLSLSTNYIASNPQLIYLWRNQDGKAVDTQGLYASYPAYFNDLPFDRSDLGRVYEVRAGDHAYRAVNYRADEESAAAGDAYVQVLVNVDSELALLESFTKALVGYLVAAVVVAAAVSYILSRKTIKPIVASMNQQTEFMQNASHELRTPLTVIRATQEQLLASPNDRVVDRFEEVGTALDETKRLSRLVDDLMTLTVVDVPRDQPAADSLDVAEVVADAGGLYADIADIQSKVLMVDAQPTGEAPIEQDALRQVLGILLDNALKYTEAGDTITLRCGVRGNSVSITVADTGCGIDPKDKPHVFDRFYRGDAARTTPGTGLGLSIAYALVARMQGTIMLEENQPRGTVVSLMLPKV